MTSVVSGESLYYPRPSRDLLRAEHVGKHISELDGPAAIVDLAIVRRNCDAMLKTADELKCSFRAHVKTHKTLEVTELQLPAPRPLKLITSTVAEIENLVPLLLEASKAGRQVDVLYGVPFNKSALRRINDINKQLLHQGVPISAQRTAPIAVMVDNIAHVKLLATEPLSDGNCVTGAFIKVDSGYHRAGIPGDSTPFQDIVTGISQGAKAVQLRGLYSHLGHSYGFSKPHESIQGLMTEIEQLLAAAQIAQTNVPSADLGALVLSVGATPTVTAAENLLTAEHGEALRDFEALKRKLDEQRLDLELHAGVYPFLDMQQLATGARPAHNDSQSPLPATLSFDDIAIRILAEVSSVYTGRGKPEALVAAGSLALGREPCKSYPGWGIVTPWSGPGAKVQNDGEIYDPANGKKGWIVGRVSQEHGILTYESDDSANSRNSNTSQRTLAVGEKLLIWPNHACITCGGYGWYYIVDSDSADADVVRDIWVRWRGW